jgi:lipoate-protein ligase A
MIADAVNELPTKIEKRITGTDEVNEVSGPQVKLKLNERYDIVEAQQSRKVSGSAYKIQRQKAYHHGTMLLSSELKILSSLLSRDIEKMGVIEGRGVESVKSPVSNVGLDKDIFITTVINSFIREYAIENPEVVVIQQEHLPKEIVQSSRQIAEYDWVFGQTPDFTHTLKISGDFNGLSEAVLKFTVSKGLLKGIELESEIDLKEIDPGLAFLNTVVQNPEQKVRYTSSQILEFVNNFYIRNGIQKALDGVSP